MRADMAPFPAPAKVNLFLHITGRRADGYHLLDSLAVFAGVGDEIRAEPADTLSLDLSGPFAASLSAEPDNLVLRAARALADAAGVPAAARLKLRKNLPVASGIGGGSTDAAATLRRLQALWATEVDLSALAVRLGADVPVCIRSRPARMGGVGDALGAAPELPVCGLALVNPGIAVATATVFGARAGGFSPPAELPGGWADAAAMAVDLARCRNDLEVAALGLCPAIGAALAALQTIPGCLLARMSGSGATCFGLFADPDQAADAAAALGRPGWWAWGGALHSQDS